MKKLTKIMLTLAAASVMTATMAVTAMADNHVITVGEYNNETGEVTLSDVLGSGKSQTILVLDNAEPDPGIAYINQIDNNGTFPSFMLEAGLKSKAPVTFNIKIGGSDKSLQTGTLTIEADAKTVTIIIGDVDLKGSVNALDLTFLGRKVKGQTTNIGKVGEVKTKADGTEVIIGDIDLKGNVNALDLTFLGRKVKGQTTNIGQAGQEVEVLDESAE